MQDAVLNLCRVKLRDQQRLQARDRCRNTPIATLATKSRVRETPRAAGSPAPRCDAAPAVPNDYCYVIIQPPIWAVTWPARSGVPNLPTIPPSVRRRRASNISMRSSRVIEQWTMKHTKHEVMRMLMDADVPCGPVFSMKDLIEDEALAQRGMIVEVPHRERGSLQNGRMLRSCSPTVRRSEGERRCWVSTRRRFCGDDGLRRKRSEKASRRQRDLDGESRCR